MSNINFYHDMPAMKHLKQITDIDQYLDMPSDWFIAITDVRNSTIAIQNGKYKEVNTVAASTITAILNSLPDIDIPFLFGGDGATIVFPPEVYDEVCHAMAAVRHVALKNFELDVRAGIVPVADVIRDGYFVKVSKIDVSQAFQQPVFTGGGLDHADKLVKTPEYAELYLIPDDVEGEADFTGLECRWSKHPASNEEVLSLLIKATTSDTHNDHNVYDDVLTTISDIYGDEMSRHPISIDKMRVAFNPEHYRTEVSWKNDHVTYWDMIVLLFWSVAGSFLWAYVERIWGQYKSVVIGATDNEKFDDTLRMTISGTHQQREALVAILDKYHQDGKLVYGVHTADHSLMTCVIFDRFNRQMHFVDADNGGYAIAAKQLKQQLEKLVSA